MEYTSILYLNSAGATSKDLTTATANFILDPVINVPSGKSVKVAVQSASFTNFFINILTGVNDKIYYTNDVGTPDKYSITIPQGSYNVSDLSDAIDLGVVNNGHTSGLLSLVPDFSTNKVLISISTAGWQIYFKLLTPYVLLGITLNQKIPAAGLTTGAYSELAPNVATFNSITQLYLHTSLTNNSVFSGKRSDVLAAITPTASIGSVQQYEPFNLVWTPAPELGGSSINSVRMYLTDQSGASVNLSDDFSCTLILAIQ